MAPVNNGRLLYNELPTGYLEPGKTTIYDDSSIVDPDTVPLNGGFLVKTLVLSIDPYLRTRMRDPSVPSFMPAFTPGEPLQNFGVGVVLRSDNNAVKNGQHVYGLFPFEQYWVAPTLDGFRIIENTEGLPWSTYLGVVGMPGQTAYYGWKEYAEAKKGETVFVTTGAGSVGSLVIQLAKQDGLKVIASAGSDEKVELMKSLGADVTFNYKTTKVAEVLKKEGPIDIYWDHVGGETLDTALDHANRGARFIECGMISGYNEKAAPVHNLWNLTARAIKMYGFIFMWLHDKYEEEFYRAVPMKIAVGEYKYVEDATEGLDQAGDALLAVLKGENKGKSVVVVAKE